MSSVSSVRRASIGWRWWWSELWRWRSVATLMRSSLSSPPSSFSRARRISSWFCASARRVWSSSSCASPAAVSASKPPTRSAASRCRASLLARSPSRFCCLRSVSLASRSIIASWPRSVETWSVAFCFSSRASSSRAWAVSISERSAFRRWVTPSICRWSRAASASSAWIWFLRASTEFTASPVMPPCRTPWPVSTSPASVTTAEPRTCGKTRSAVSRSGTRTVWLTSRSTSRCTSDCGLILRMSQSIAPSGRVSGSDL